MSREKLKYISDKALSELRKSITINRQLYMGGDFSELARTPSWDIELGIDYDAELLMQLDIAKPVNVVPVDLKNSIIVGESLKGLTPALANEERIWVRLAHTDALVYCRERWLKPLTESTIDKRVNDHLFGASHTILRDDHALSRLWWNHYIATVCMPENPKRALELILSTADIRDNFIQRTWMISRPCISGAVLRGMDKDPWVCEHRKHFRSFMRALNRAGGGLVFEALSEAEMQNFIGECIADAKKDSRLVISQVP